MVRRQELIGEVRGVAVVDDFAHHPTAIRATLEAIAERFAGRRILAAFEPRSNTARRNVFQDGFAAAFDRAARVYLAPVYFKDNDPIPADGRLSIEELAAEIGRRGPAAFACASTDDILARMLADARAGDVALVHVERSVRQFEGAVTGRAQDFELAASRRKACAFLARLRNLAQSRGLLSVFDHDVAGNFSVRRLTRYFNSQSADRARGEVVQ